MVALNWADYAILTIIAISIAISLWRGFTKEALSLAGWIVAAWVSIHFAEKLQYLLEKWIDIPSIRLAVAFVSLFIVTLFLVAFVNFLVGQAIKKTGLSGTDRMVGIFFGLARGIVIIAVLVFIAGMTPLPQDPWWGESQLLHYFEEIAAYLRQFIPPDLSDNVRFS